jgi:hypothetical protein
VVAVHARPEDAARAEALLIREGGREVHRTE